MVREEEIPIQGSSRSFLDKKFGSPTCYDLEPLIFSISKLKFKKGRFVDEQDHVFASVDEATVIDEGGRRIRNQRILRTHAREMSVPNGNIVRVITGIGSIDGIWKALAPEGASWRVRRDMTCSPPRSIQEALTGEV